MRKQIFQRVEIAKVLVSEMAMSSRISTEDAKAIKDALADVAFECSVPCQRCGGEITGVCYDCGVEQR